MSTSPHAMPQLPYLDPTVVQADITMVLTFLTPIIGLIPGVKGNAILEILQKLVSDPNFLNPVIALINKISGATPPTQA